MANILGTVGLDTRNVLSKSTSANTAIINPPRKLCEWIERPERGPPWDGFTSAAIIITPLPPRECTGALPRGQCIVSDSTF